MNILKLLTVIDGKGKSILSFKLESTLRKWKSLRKKTWGRIGGGKQNVIIFASEPKLAK